LQSGCVRIMHFVNMYIEIPTDQHSTTVSAKSLK